MKLAFIDVETTGLKPEEGHRVVECAVEVVDVTRTGFRMIEEYEFRARVPQRLPSYEGAFKINGYDDSPNGAWHGAPLVDDPATAAAWRRVVTLTMKLPLCSQNVPFDRAFMEAECARHGVRPGWGRRFVDIMSFAVLIAIENEIGEFGLHKVYEKLAAEKLPEHRSKADIARGKRVFGEVHKRFFHAVKTHEQLAADPPFGAG